MKKLLSIIVFSALSLNAQVGINKNLPTSTLDVNGSLSANYRQVTAATYTLADNDCYVTYNGTANSTFTLPNIGSGSSSYAGRVYKIKNVSAFNITLQASGGNTLRVDNTAVSTLTIPTGAYAEVVNNNNTTGGTWDISYATLPRPSNVEIYGAQLSIPPHAGVADWTGHSNTGYDTGTGTDVWWVISKASTSYIVGSGYSNASRMTIVYEYQGTPFNITNMNPILTAGNNSSFPDVFIASFLNLANNGTAGRTRLTVSVARVDFVGNNFTNNSNWTGTFLLNLLLSRKVY